ncbi:MAG: zinc-binding dehydrogenase [Bdellovibrionota bacterium]
MMKALYFTEHGDSSVLKFGDLEQPELKTGEVLIEVKAASLNHLDIWVRKGWPGINLKLPHIGGSDIAGKVVKSYNQENKGLIGKEVVVNPGVITKEDRWTRSNEDSLSPGYKILGEQLPGGCAQFAAVPAANILEYPKNFTAEQAAASVLVGITSWRMLFNRASLRAEQSVLIVGSGGGVNLMSLLIAKAKGAEVIMICGGADKSKKALDFGADHVIDYKTDADWHKSVLKLTKGLGAEIVVDNVGSATFEKSIRSAARGGCVVTVGNTSGWNIAYDNRLIFTKQLSILGSTMGSQKDFLDAMKFIWKKEIKVPIDNVAPLKHGKAMHERIESGEQFGKIVLVP